MIKKLLTVVLLFGAMGIIADEWVPCDDSRKMCLKTTETKPGDSLRIIEAQRIASCINRTGLAYSDCASNPSLG